MQLAKSEFMTPHQALAANGKSFDWARRFLGKRMGGDAATLYRFCRVLDDMADDDIPNGPRRLSTIRKDLAGGHHATDPLLADFQPFILQQNLPVPVIIALIDGLLQDQRPVRIANERALRRYAYRVAGTVGLMTQGVMGVDGAYTSAPWSDRPDTSDAAVALGIANQLTNILRDVGEDRGRGRIYLPLEDLERFGYSEDDLMAGRLNNAWSELMQFQLQRARDWFARSEAGVRWLSRDARWPVWTSLRLYRGILDAIERVDYDVFNNRAYVGKISKFLDLPRSFVLAQAR